MKTVARRVAATVVAALLVPALTAPGAFATATAQDMVQYTPPPAVLGDQAVPFYTPAAAIPKAKGSVIRTELTRPGGLDFILPIKGSITKVLYTSEDLFGKPTVVSGMVIVPTAAWQGPGARPVIGYAPGTRGWADKCAPSKSIAEGKDYEAIIYKAFVDKGYAVAVTDYAGLGTQGVHPYMVKSSEGNATLDVLRAAINLNVGGITKDSPMAVFGYSQGGGAAGAAVERAPIYAPELNLRAAAVGAPPSDLAAVAAHVDGKLLAGVTFGSVAGVSYAFNRPETIPAVYNAKGQEAVKTVMSGCIGEIALKFLFSTSASYTSTGEPLAVLVSREPQRSVNEAQKLGKLKPSAPVMVYGSTADDVIPYPQVEQVAKDWCAKGATVQLSSTSLPTHGGAILTLMKPAIDYVAARLTTDAPAPNNCGK